MTIDGPRLPHFFTPEEVAHHFGWSPRKVREFARQIGACRILGNKMVLTQEDLDALIEALKPAPLSRRTVVTATHPVYPMGSYAELVQLRQKQKKEAQGAKKKR